MIYTFHIKARDKEFKEEYLKVTFEASVANVSYADFISQYLEKLNKINSDLTIDYDEYKIRFYFKMPFEISYEELFEEGFQKVCEGEMHNFKDLLLPILKIFSDKNMFTDIFDDIHKPTPIQLDVSSKK